jgi:hypothetical protein
LTSVVVEQSSQLLAAALSALTNLSRTLMVFRVSLAMNNKSFLYSQSNKSSQVTALIEVRINMVDFDLPTPTGPCGGQ